MCEALSIPQVEEQALGARTRFAGEHQRGRGERGSVRRSWCSMRRGGGGSLKTTERRGGDWKQARSQRVNQYRCCFARHEVRRVQGRPQAALRRERRPPPPWRCPCCPWPFCRPGLPWRLPPPPPPPPPPPRPRAAEQAAAAAVPPRSSASLPPTLSPCVPSGRRPWQQAHQRSHERCPPVILEEGAPGSVSLPQKTSPFDSRQHTLRSNLRISRAHSVQGAEQPGEPSERKRKMQRPPPRRRRT